MTAYKLQQCAESLKCDNINKFVEIPHIGLV